MAITDLTKEDISEFEEDIANEFNAGRIPHPVHLNSGSEEQLIKIFEDVGPEDWCLCNWRSHIQCLLRGVSKEELKNAIMAGHSITLNFPKHRIFSSAIVTGTYPIGIGIALEIKRRGGKEKVWIFSGEMGAETGSFFECCKYAHANDLPVIFVVENNFRSVCTPTFKTWGIKESFWVGGAEKVKYFEYDASKYPHAGAGKRVTF